MRAVWRLLVSRTAARDIDDLESHIAAETRGRAQRDMTSLAKGIERLALAPELGVKVGRCFRHMYLRGHKCGFVVRYRLRDNLVFIHRIGRTEKYLPPPP